MTNDHLLIAFLLALLLLAVVLVMWRVEIRDNRYLERFANSQQREITDLRAELARHRVAAALLTPDADLSGLLTDLHALPLTHPEDPR